MIDVIHCTHKLDCRALLGKFCDKRHYDRLITANTDFYCGREAIFKLRKQAFTAHEQALTYRALRGAATTSSRRGLAAGPIDYTSRLGNRDWVKPMQGTILEQMGADVSKLNRTTRTQAFVWLKKAILEEHPRYEGWFDQWLAPTLLLNSEDQKTAAQHVVDFFVSNTTYPMPVMSGVAGYMGANDPRNPYGRMTPYTARHAERFSLCLPYVKKLDGIFRRELPERWKKQRQAADRIDQRHLIDRTSFTTLTINHNFRTAAHRDDGDLADGFSSLAAFTGPEGRAWRGGELILPEYRVAIKLHPGDLILVDNHAAVHANAPLVGDGHDNDRLTVVAYFREDMLNLGSWEEEVTKEKYVRLARARGVKVTKV